MGRWAFLIICGLGGAVILVSLGVWQIQRLAEKQAFIADIEARIAADPVPLPDAPDPTEDAYLPVTVTGEMRAPYLKVLVSQKQIGAGYRIISPMKQAAGDILIDLGFVRVDEVETADLQSEGLRTVVGNLQWPRETDSFTPAPDLTKNIWFARDVASMAAALGTRPILVVQREISQHDGPVTPLPVDTSAIPNDHLQYAITWFSLAVVWLGMTAMFLRRSRGTTQS